ncbi:hypothetical protein AVEN_55191-1 [Araneus ventricosus]|uniref:Reverse transcriptase RNase H-like domain-containing protein n=1 Tax=Araneus ventricosus TaxID=182803 RepID=A0A4Y2J600_ARAVE|nr:hypothetical protein AVEN_55191-1 [Araneus ventricosus]
MQDFDSLRLVKCRLSDECTKHVPRNVLVVLPAGAHALSGLRRARSQKLWKDQGFQFLDRRCTRMTGRTADASKHGYGTVLLQEAEDGKLQPIYYMSKKTNPAEEKYDSYVLEVLAIATALKKFRVYILGQHFKIVTDCSTFQKTIIKKYLITRIARWALQLEELDYEIEHRFGKRMHHVDALSRHPVMIISKDTLTAKLKKARDEDENIQTLKSLLEEREFEEFFERNGILYKYLSGRELIIAPKEMQVELIKLVHENGHF